jgi:hypothetical protein
MESNADFFVIIVTPSAMLPTEFHTGEEINAEQRNNFRTLLYENFLELLQHVDSPHVRRE